MIRLLPERVSSHLRSGVAITSVTQCVEELVLNSLDAGANCVAVRVDMPCFKIQVVDNGSGIPTSQLDVIATRHYTSKCKELTDLDNLEYFGFRGEALASICEISAILDISTKVKQSTKTYCKLFHNGKARPSCEAKLQRPAAGTTVTVHDLFNKLPVRKRMTNQILELERIKQRLEAIALMNPRVSMSLRNDENGNKILQTNKCSSTLGIFKQLYGAVKASNLSEVSCVKDHFRVSGYISSEGHFNKTLQYIYINTRLVLKTEIHKFLNKALKKFYSSRKKAVNTTSQVITRSFLLSSSPTKQWDKHGVFVVNVSCPFSEYDITFDPTKTLVEFKDWETVLSAMNGIVEEFQQQFSASVSPVDTMLDAASVDCTQPNVHKSKLTDATVEPDSPKDLEMSPVDAKTTLYSKTVKSSKSDAAVIVSSFPNKVVAEKAEEDSDLEISENFEDNFPAFSEITEKSVSPVISSVSSDSSSTLTCTSLSVKGSANDEDPLSTPCKPRVIPLHNKSKTPGGEANDSGIDPGMTADADPVCSGSNVCPQSVRLHKPTVKTFKSMFKQPKGSRLSSLREKHSKSEKLEINTKSVTCRLKELRETLYETTIDREKCSSSEACAKSSVLSSLKKLRGTVEHLQSMGETSPEASSSKTTTCTCQNNVPLKVADIHNRGTTTTLTGKRRPGIGRETVSSKLARLAGIGDQETNSSLQSAESKLPLATQNGSNLCDTDRSVDAESARKPDMHSVLDCSVSNHYNQSYVPMNPTGEQMVRSGTGSSGNASQKCILNQIVSQPVISRRTTETAKVNQFMTTESLITTLSALPKNSSDKSEVSVDQTKRELKHEADFAFNQQYPLGTAATYKSDNSSELRHADLDNFSVSAKVRHVRGGKTTTSEKHPVMKACNLESCESRVMNVNSVTCDQEIHKESCSQDGKIRRSQDSHNMVDATNVLKSYLCDSEQSNISYFHISHDDTISEHSEPVGKSDTKLGKPEQSTDVEFDFRTMKSIVNSPKNVQKDDSGLFMTVDISSTPDSDVKTFSSPDTLTRESGRGVNSDQKPSDRDLTDLLTTPPSHPAVVNQTRPCSNHPALCDCLPRKPYQCISEFGSSSHSPTFDTKLYTENENSFTTHLSVHDDKIAGSSTNEVTASAFVESSVKVEAPANVARVTVQRDESSDVSLHLETSSADDMRDTMLLSQDKEEDICDDVCLNKQSRGVGVNVQVQRETGHHEHERKITSVAQAEAEYQLNSKTEHSEACQSKPDDFLIRNHPMSGKKIFIHPLTGHSLNEAGWELWFKQSINPEHTGDQELILNRKLLSHDLAYTLSKPSTSNTVSDDQSTRVGNTSGETTGNSMVDELWANHLTHHYDEDSIKWRNPSFKACGVESESMTDLFGEWDNPVFSVPEQDITSAELPARQKGAGKTQSSIHQCRFTKDMFNQVQVMGQVDDKFIACMMRTGEGNLSADGNLLVLVDQHAAHERVRLEQLAKESYVTNAEGDRVLKSSVIIPPSELRLAEELVRVMTAYQAKFEQLGVVFSTTDKRDTILVKSAPSCFIEREASEIKRGRTSVVMEMIEAFMTEQVELLKSTNGALATCPASVHRLLCSQACHGAIKFGDSLSLEECEDLLRSLSYCNLPFQCAHGRPSVMPLLDFDHFKAKFPPKFVCKPKLWKLRQMIEESVVEESADEKTERTMDVDSG